MGAKAAGASSTGLQGTRALCTASASYSKRLLPGALSGLRGGLRGAWLCAGQARGAGELTHLETGLSEAQQAV